MVQAYKLPQPLRWLGVYALSGVPSLHIERLTSHHVSAREQFFGSSVHNSYSDECGWEPGQ